MSSRLPYCKEKQREYQKRRVKARRQAWLCENGPCANCRSGKDLQVDHRDTEEKVRHRVWSWSAVRREAELAKCQPLCSDCHKLKTYQQRFATTGPRTGATCRCRLMIPRY